MSSSSGIRNKVESVDPHGEVVLRSEDGTYVLAQQIDAKPLSHDQVLEGLSEEIGVSRANDPITGAVYEFFVEAYGLSREAALRERA